MSIVLMYHGLYRDDSDLQRIEPVDRPYAVQLDDFRIQLEMIARLSHGTLNDSPSGAESAAPIQSLPEVVLTFDDGHLSGYDLALPLLCEFGIKAYFFVTTDFIEKRENFCTWMQLLEMHTNGMVIGSHGKTHQFFEGMPPEQAKLEFESSRHLIEHSLGTAADTFSFPGGRYSAQNLDQARMAGYARIFGSKFGTLNSGQLFDNSPINRIPIRRTTSASMFEKIIASNRGFFIAEQTKGALKRVVKKALGNTLYHNLYKSVSERR